MRYKNIHRLRRLIGVICGDFYQRIDCDPNPRPQIFSLQNKNVERLELYALGDHEVNALGLVAQAPR